MLSDSLFNNLIIGWIILAIIIFPLLLKITVPYGRHTNNRWGPTINNRLGWVLMELPVLLVFTYYFLKGENLNPVVWSFYLLFMLHYLNRVFIFPFRIKSNGKRMPLVIALLAVSFNYFNGWFNGNFLAVNTDLYSVEWFYKPQFLIGITFFFIGMYINMRSDNILLSLRKGGKKGYFIPQGFLFKYVSSPNLLGEIIEWTGWAILCWNLPAFSFALWTYANLIPRALDHHRWYKRRFDDYPTTRKALIPRIL